MVFLAGEGGDVMKKRYVNAWVDGKVIEIEITKHLEMLEKEKLEVKARQDVFEFDRQHRLNQLEMDITYDKEWIKDNYIAGEDGEWRYMKIWRWFGGFKSES